MLHKYSRLGFEEIIFSSAFFIMPKMGQKKTVVTNNHFKILPKSICEIVLNLYMGAFKSSWRGSFCIYFSLKWVKKVIFGSKVNTFGLSVNLFARFSWNRTWCGALIINLKWLLWKVNFDGKTWHFKTFLYRFSLS